MTQPFVKRRQTVSKHGSFGNAGRAAMRGKRKASFPKGMFERFRPYETALWIRLIPGQSYEYDSFNRETYQVERTETPWFEYFQHFIPSKKRGFICSCTAYRNKGCYGCAILARHDDDIEKGLIDKGTHAPVGFRSQQFAMPVTVVEKIISIPVMDNRGQVRTDKGGKTIYRHTPEPVAELDTGVNFPTKYGHNMHWSMGQNHLNQLISMDDKLVNSCGNCAHPLYAVATVCSNCENELEVFDEPVQGEDLLQLRKKFYSCNSCGYEGHGQPMVECTHCDAPEDGGIMKFEIRIKAVPIDDRKTVLELVDFRLPSTNEDIQQLLKEPLKVDEIFAPTPVAAQKSIIGDDIIRGVDSMYGAWDSGNDSDDHENTQSSVNY